MRLDQATDFEGTCQDMCPEWEREEREYQNNVDPLERVGPFQEPERIWRPLTNADDVYSYSTRARLASIRLGPSKRFTDPRPAMTSRSLPTFDRHQSCSAPSTTSSTPSCRLNLSQRHIPSCEIELVQSDKTLRSKTSAMSTQCAATNGSRAITSSLLAFCAKRWASVSSKSSSSCEKVRSRERSASRANPSS